MLFWLRMKGVQYELLVWFIMGQRGYSQNAGLLVALVLFAVGTILADGPAPLCTKRSARMVMTKISCPTCVRPTHDEHSVKISFFFSNITNWLELRPPTTVRESITNMWFTCCQGRNLSYSLIQLSHLAHWGRVMHVCVSKIIIIGSDNSLLPVRCQAIIWTNAGILLIGPLGINFGEISVKINTFSFKKMHLKMSAEWRLFHIGLNELNIKCQQIHLLVLNFELSCLDVTKWLVLFWLSQY